MATGVWLTVSKSRSHVFTYSLPGAQHRPVTWAAPALSLGPRRQLLLPLRASRLWHVNSQHLHPGGDWRDRPISRILKVKNELMMAEKVPF